jgi:uncharacterized membrane protein YGL010W
MTSIESHFADYARYHATPGNKACHRLGIPMIMFSLLGLLSEIDTPVDLALVLVALASVYYLLLAWRLALVMLAATLAMWLVARELALWVHWVLFVAGWILQGVGHSVYEKKQPAFFRNFVHLLVGPLWIANDLLPAGLRIVPLPVPDAPGAPGSLTPAD